MLLSDLLVQPLPALYNCSLTGLTLDSRAVRPGDIFLACQGTQVHGEIYIESAIQKGAVAILKEAPIHNIKTLTNGVPCISIPHLSQQIGGLAARFYGYPSRHKRIIGVTGTNGKTSVTHLIAQILQKEAPCGLFGTLGYGIYGALQSGLHTTPDAIQLQTLLAQLGTQNVSQVVMEVSSHALVQGRVNGITFETAVLTNLSRDHLDYHQTMTAYGNAKRQLFAMPDLKTAVINYDDVFGQDVLADLPSSITPLSYSTHDKKADVYAQIHAYDIHGCKLDIHTSWGKGQLHSPLFGQFNVSNVLAALTVLLNMGFPLSQLLTQLNIIEPIPGRMERFGQANQPTVIIDYAHTPDALEKTLLALHEHLKEKKPSESNHSHFSDINTPTPKLWCVFGCGGDRDHGKRQLMGEIAQRYADKVIITDDNPRHETSQAIIDNILQGCPSPTAVISNREQAIHYALQNAMINDIVLIAGKGHENYQQIGDQRLPFSDKAVVSSLLNMQKE
ncbi:UDP-N-acetylmuramoyl-L-alanyl-D-glutamate--2,6-diaminopimelate ligase [Candidatus Parabeggiatoa sp. HSG14]|uniref:UDP-N-acetylmuramoyl-L-alanyl-D-glutamate--2, 6-diaminopimelate ligase n=1 Tax=Candidatus Parabeggiatoa sp. HSG14 TaxID=3055593 RepID=UPI0025A85C87|nr:UDP-N-acetylmuramoyl-L-alanyl-D-glutamate--2,6-diaminopimelate ligase [Thiotrichales bacterium HSG14]